MKALHGSMQHAIQIFQQRILLQRLIMAEKAINAILLFNHIHQFSQLFLIHIAIMEYIFADRISQEQYFFFRHVNADRIFRMRRLGMKYLRRYSTEVQHELSLKLKIRLDNLQRCLLNVFPRKIGVAVFQNVDIRGIADFRLLLLKSKMQVEILR